MSDVILEYGVHLFVLVAATYLAFSFLNECSSTADDVRAQALADTDASLGDLYINMNPSTFFSLRILAAVLGFIVGMLIGGVIFGALLAAAGYFLPMMYLKKLRAARVVQVEAQLVEGLELLKNGLKSGLTIQQSSELVIEEFPPPISQEFALVMAESRLGVDFVDGLQNMANRLQSPIVQILASGVAITKKCGGDLGDIFGNLAETIREQAKIEGKLNAVTAQGRFQGLILGLMPYALLIVLYFVDRTHVQTLFSSQIGIFALIGVTGMVIMAQLWIRKLLDIDV